MCSRLGSKGDVSPGTYQVIKTKKGTQLNLYGFNNGYQYNVRRDSMDTVWKKLKDNRGIFQIDSFWEKGKQFVRTDNKLFKIAVLYDVADEFAVITTNANPIVKPFHQRMPLCLTDKGETQFLKGEEVWEELPLDMYKLNNAKLATA